MKVKTGYVFDYYRCFIIECKVVFIIANLMNPFFIEKETLNKVAAIQEVILSMRTSLAKKMLEEEEKNLDQNFRK